MKAFCLTTLLTIGTALSAFAQERAFELGAHVGGLTLADLDTTNPGFGARAAFWPTALFALDGELTYFPSDVPGDVPVTRSRLEGLLGVRAGPRFEHFGVFGKLRPGFVRFGEAPEPVACIAIFPPPLSCVIAAGTTVFALDVGGGVELYPSARTVVRADVSSLMLRHPGPVLRPLGEGIDDGARWSRNLRFTFSVGLRF